MQTIFAVNSLVNNFMYILSVNGYFEIMNLDPEWLASGLDCESLINDAHQFLNLFHCETLQ